MLVRFWIVWYRLGLAFEYTRVAVADSFRAEVATRMYTYDFGNSNDSTPDTTQNRPQRTAPYTPPPTQLPLHTSTYAPPRTHLPLRPPPPVIPPTSYTLTDSTTPHALPLPTPLHPPPDSMCIPSVPPARPNYTYLPRPPLSPLPLADDSQLIADLIPLTL